MRLEITAAKTVSLYVSTKRDVGASWVCIGLIRSFQTSLSALSHRATIPVFLGSVSPQKGKQKAAIPSSRNSRVPTCNAFAYLSSTPSATWLDKTPVITH